MTESESVALPLGDTAIFCFPRSFRPANVIISDYSPLVNNLLQSFSTFFRPAFAIRSPSAPFLFYAVRIPFMQSPFKSFRGSLRRCRRTPTALLRPTGSPVFAHPGIRSRVMKNPGRLSAAENAGTSLCFIGKPLRLLSFHILHRCHAEALPETGNKVGIIRKAAFFTDLPDRVVPLQIGK